MAAPAPARPSCAITNSGGGGDQTLANGISRRRHPQRRDGPRLVSWFRVGAYESAFRAAARISAPESWFLRSQLTPTPGAVRRAVEDVDDENAVGERLIAAAARVGDAQEGRAGAGAAIDDSRSDGAPSPAR